MLSLGQVVLIVAVGAWSFGPKELPRVARSVGRLAGRASGMLYSMRAQFLRFAGEAEMHKVHAEAQTVLHQLRAIQAELQGGLSLSQPGPLASRLLQQMDPGMAAQQAHQQPEQGQQPQRQWPPGHAPQGAAAAPRHHAPPASFASGAAAGEPGLPAAAAAALGGGGPGSPLSAGPSDAPGHHPAILPISAVAAGLAPDRAGTSPSTSDIMLDALWEERVAQQAQRFFQQGQQAQ